MRTTAFMLIRASSLTLLFSVSLLSFSKGRNPHRNKLKVVCLFDSTVAMMGLRCAKGYWHLFLIAIIHKYISDFIMVRPRG